MPALMNDQKFKLKYLFRVDYLDGSQFVQPQDDHSELDPKKSAFYDVLQSGKRIKKFTLVGYNWLSKEEYSVDLTTGLFEINKVEVQVGDNPPAPVPRELIFYRQHQHDTLVTYGLQKGEIRSHEPGGHRCKYFLGWKFNVGGKNYQEQIGID